uniref:Uncharacterized protein n=1 Tax=Acanthochromis polyacanthus TaxID=80966 RepID=A0A3Q1GJZ9_9TELE
MESQVEDLVAVLLQRLNLHTGDAVEQTLELPIPRHTWDAVVAVEQLPPQELISGDSKPLSAGQTGSQHSIVGQTQEDLQHQAVRQSWAPLHPNILRDTHTHQAECWEKGAKKSFQKQCHGWWTMPVCSPFIRLFWEEMSKTTSKAHIDSLIHHGVMTQN